MATPPDRNTVPTEVGGRYLLRGELGRGGMATVHRAWDRALEREVAVKLLHAHLAHDPSFLDRFRREAQAAAGLSHPNVVAVHDWGETDDGPYLVMQLVVGVSLRDVLGAQHRLSAQEVLGVLGPTAAGLGAAHQAGLIHRDVKPENILLGSDASVRLTDFGLARAAASATATFGEEVLVGSPHYLSPEAVRGERLDPRADVYALGVVLFECLTGRPPFEGESPFATAVAHTSRSVPAPSAVRTGIAPELDALVLAATTVDRDRRPEDARAFDQLLQRAVADGPQLPELTGLLSGAVAGDDDRPHSATALLPVEDTPTALTQRPQRLRLPAALWRGTADRRRDEGGQSTRNERSRRQQRKRRSDAEQPASDSRPTGRIEGDTSRLDGLAPPTERNSPDPPQSAPPRPDPPRPDPPRPHPPRPGTDGPPPIPADAEAVVRLPSPTASGSQRGPAHRSRGSARRRLLVLLLVVGLLAASAGGGYLLWDRVLAPITPIPTLLGTPDSLARATLIDAGFEVEVEPDRTHDLDVPIDHVVAQDPTGQARTGTVVHLTLSAGPRQVDVPDVVGEPLVSGASSLRDAGLDLEVEREHHEAIDPGRILRTQPEAGTRIDEASRVVVVVSLGPPPVEVPAVVGEPLAEALATLARLGLAGEAIERRYDEDVPAGHVLAQRPEAGRSLIRGEVVELEVSDGPRPIPVPNVRDQQVDAAVAELEALGFRVEVERRGGFGALLNPGRVFDQEPAGGASRFRGEVIVLFAYEG